jgi:hypothetical protein
MKGGTVPPQPARPTIRLGQAAALTLFVATLAILTGLFFTFVPRASLTTQNIALLLSTLCAIVATFGMGWDAIDLWLRGRKMTPYSVKMFRSMVFVAVIGALATSFVARTTAPVLILAPSMFVYLFVSRRPAAGGAATQRSAASGGARTGTVSSARARQRRGGKKRK